MKKSIAWIPFFGLIYCQFKKEQISEIFDSVFIAFINGVYHGYFVMAALIYLIYQIK